MNADSQIAYRVINFFTRRGSVVGQLPASRDQVVRHRCYNQRCVRPEHLIEGSASDNKRDDWDNWTKGGDFDLLYWRAHKILDLGTY